MLSAANDSQFAILCSPAVFDRQDWLNNPKFASNMRRVQNRDEVINNIEQVLSERTTVDWCERLHGKG
jgi:succinate--hydroxymethylglutarate CoA-transferase